MIIWPNVYEGVCAVVVDDRVVAESVHKFPRCQAASVEADPPLGERG